MKQVVQSAGGGAVEVVDAPRPTIGATEVLVLTDSTLISAGTERAVTRLAQKNLADKARARPDLVKQVIQKARSEGVRPTIQAVRSRLADDVPLGYSGAGSVVEVGAAVEGIRLGQRVATAGQGYASHAEYQRVPGLLCSIIPEELSSDKACFATVASIGLHGIRQAHLGPGSKVVVVGLGLIGQLTMRIALAAGCDVVGVDVRAPVVDLASKHGATGLVESGTATTSAIMDWSRGRGADAVLITAGAQGDSRIIRSVPERCRDRAQIVAIGDIGLDLDRNEFYHKELVLHVPRSYGPGRYDRSYEEWAVDYPVGQVRWTEGRNLEAVLDLIASDRLTVTDLVSHRFDIVQATKAYDALDNPEAGVLGIVLDYPEREGKHSRTIRLSNRHSTPLPNQPAVGVLGAGLFTRSTVLPALGQAGFGPVTHIASASGISAARTAERHSISHASSRSSEVIDDPKVDVVVIATPHSTHATLTVQALDAGKHVYCEKPLALSTQELDSVRIALEQSDANLYVGFNRRHSPMIGLIRERLDLAGTGPINMVYRVNAGQVPADHWYADRREGGRLLGEVCHFIDTCSYLAHDQVAQVSCTGSQSHQRDSYALLISYQDGSSASIVYSADAHPSTPKEHLEVLGRGQTYLVDNFQVMRVNGKKVSVQAGKGHVEGLRSFLDGTSNCLHSLQTTQLALQALDSLNNERR